MSDFQKLKESFIKVVWPISGPSSILTWCVLCHQSMVWTAWTMERNHQKRERRSRHKHIPSSPPHRTASPVSMTSVPDWWTLHPHHHYIFFSHPASLPHRDVSLPAGLSRARNTFSSACASRPARFSLTNHHSSVPFTIQRKKMKKKNNWKTKVTVI